MRLFRRVGSRTVHDTPDTPSSQDPQLTALRFDTQISRLNDSGDQTTTTNDSDFSSRTKTEGDHIKQLQQIFKPPTSPTISTFIARSETSSPKTSRMPKSKVAGGKKIVIIF